MSGISDLLLSLFIFKRSPENAFRYLVVLVILQMRFFIYAMLENHLMMCDMFI